LAIFINPYHYSNVGSITKIYVIIVAKTAKIGKINV
jgi:hypothetical protein